MSLDEHFKAACDQVKKFTKKPTDAEMLEIYSLFKQATVAKPNDAKGKSKWDAWNGKKGMKTATAKEQYIAKAKTLGNTYA